MEWVARALKEASKVQGNSVRRLKFYDHFSEFFCLRNFDKFGPKRKAVIIVQNGHLILDGWTLLPKPPTS